MVDIFPLTINSFCCLHVVHCGALLWLRLWPVIFCKRVNSLKLFCLISLPLRDQCIGLICFLLVRDRAVHSRSQIRHRCFRGDRAWRGLWQKFLLCVDPWRSPNHVLNPRHAVVAAQCPCDVGCNFEALSRLLWKSEETFVPRPQWCRCRAGARVKMNDGLIRDIENRGTSAADTRAICCDRKQRLVGQTTRCQNFEIEIRA